MIRTHHQQPTLWTGFLNEEVNDLWEPWMRSVDPLLDDEQLIEQIFEAQGRRWKKSRTRGRMQTPSDVVLRLLVLKHVRDWSYQTLEREVRANLVYPASAGKKCLTRKRWAVWGRRSARTWWPACIGAWWSWQWSRKWCRPQDAGGHDGGGNQHSLPDR